MSSHIEYIIQEALSTPIKVLDHGLVRLVDYMGTDISIVRAARVSYDAAWRAGEDEGSDARLIKYLWKNHHTTPFEAVSFTFEIRAPIFTIRQWHRHRTQSYNELSARYRELPEVFYIPKAEQIGVQATTNKQGREFQDDPGLEERLISKRGKELQIYTSTCQASFETYRMLIAEGWPRELARMVLPFSTYTHMFVTMNLLNLMKFLTLRCHSHAQYEIRVYADAMRDLVRLVVPVSIEAWEATFNK